MIYNFEKLQLPGRASLLWAHGELIADRVHEVNIITLYRLFDFHVEVFCDSGFTEIEDIRIINEEKRVQLYQVG
jgi:hypothetical protein